ncbi:hypothetical protein [Nostoc sp. CmiVER01]|nr:hypothetical protein [Nostoc sp. CmiVER01]MDZ8225926.1 hypothetical protein [Nostoc sp. ChiVER01]
MTTQHQTTSAANQFFTGDASALSSLLMQLHQWASTTKLALDVSK